MPSHREPLVIDLVSDFVCPWCYIGFRALDWAKMALSFQYTLNVRYRPYRLDPGISPEGRDRKATLEAKFPDISQRQKIQEALNEAMQDVGLNFDPQLPERLPDTTDAHRLVRWAGEEGLAHEAVAALFDAYWQSGMDISRAEVLNIAADEAGLDGADMVRRLETGEDRDAVRQEAAELRGGGVRGVPAFIINETAGFEGALRKGALIESLRILAAETAAP